MSYSTALELHLLAEALARERHRLETLQEVKVEPDNFKSHLRAFPVVIVQPDSSELACGRKISFDRSSEGFRTLDIETGHAEPSSSSLDGITEDPSHSSRRESRCGSPEEAAEKEEGEVSYNPLTHYLTGTLVKLQLPKPFTMHSACIHSQSMIKLYSCL